MFDGMTFAVVEWEWDCGRMGSLECLMVLDRTGMGRVLALIEEEASIYFGEVLGKHSEVYGNLKPDEFKVRASGPDARIVHRVLSGGADMPVDGWYTISGMNPLDQELFDDE